MLVKRVIFDTVISGITVGSGGTYTTLKAAFDKINDGTHTGDVVLHIVGDATETATAVLNTSGSGSADYTSVTIYPTVTGKTITGNLNTPLVQLNGANNVTIDGRLNATGSTNDLTIENQNTGTVASNIELLNGASNNTIKYTNLKGSSNASTTATVEINGSSSTGNSDNIIEYNNFTLSGSNRPLRSVLISGSSGVNNDANIVRYNNFYNCHTGLEGNFSVVLDVNSTNTTISYNSFYEESSYSTSGTGNSGCILGNSNLVTITTITYNSIGGSSANCSGVWTKTGSGAAIGVGFHAIRASGNGAASVYDVTYNTIKNFDYSGEDTYDWYGIRILSTGNSSTIDNNTIGDGANSIKLTSDAATNVAYGIRGRGTISNNTINGISTYNTSTAQNFAFNGIYPTSLATITGNVITNILLDGISTSNNNQLIWGIRGVGANTFVVTDNIISNLTNKSTRTTATDCIVGIQCLSSLTTANNNIARNFIHSFTAAGTVHSIIGIKVISGAATHSNNIISLDSDTQTKVYGIYDTGASGNNLNLYYNTVYIYGTPSGSADSYALYSNDSANTRNFRNNLFVNARTTNGSHYAAYFNYAVNTNLTLDYNDYFVSGTGGVLGYYNSANKTSLPIVNGRNANSINANPNFVSVPSTTASDYDVTNTALEVAVSGTGITVDYSTTTREEPLTIGAWEL
jgi:hypothetical protein